MYTLPAALFVWALGFIRSVDGMPSGDLESRETATQALFNGTFSFNSISNMTTCEPALITWNYTHLSGEDLPNLILSVTNLAVPEPTPPLSTTFFGSFSQHDTRGSYLRRDVITEQISGPISPSLERFEWSSVNVSGGSWYAIVATVDGAASAFTGSLNFFIQDGPDVSCTLPPTSTGDPSSSGGTYDGSLIGGIVFMAVVLPLVVAGSVLACVKRRKRSSNSSHPNHAPSGDPQTTSRSEYADAAHGSAWVMMNSPRTAPSPSQFQPQLPYLASRRPRRQSADYAPQQQSRDPVLHTDDTDVRRILDEQRAIEAEWARPMPWIDDSDKVRPNAGASTVPPNAGTSTELQNPSVQSMMAEMAALRAQVARLEGAHGKQVELPPAYIDV
ncbi:hypothetical protein C8R46DRAFT_1196904 [Mycena filopes]|nr:hypothetical protein C8R46DRAFT_1196904 [Mycena filopes]